MKKNVFYFAIYSYENGDDLPPNWDVVIAEELYNLTDDPNQLLNVAGYPEFKEVQTEMEERLQAGWRQALPPQ